MRRGATLGMLAALFVTAAVALGGARPARSDHGILFCLDERVLVEPTHTRGRTNTIRWEAVEAKCWNHGTDRRFIVSITNTATGDKDTVTVHGGSKVEATVGADDFPGGVVDGQRFSYRVARKSKRCLLEGPLGTCLDSTTDTAHFDNEVASIQDDRAPTGSLVLAGGRTFVRTLDVPATVTATDPGGAASGAGYVAFGGSGRRGGCGPSAGCAEPIAPSMTVRLEPGADGQRTVEARVYDRARGPADDPGATTVGTPPGNVSAQFQDTVYLDRTAPAIFIRISTVRVMAGAPVTFDASQSVDTSDGSGLQPVTGEWSFGDGGRDTGLVTTHAYARTGRFPVTFAVADSVGNVARTEGEIEVVAVPVPPQPQTTETPPQGPPPATVDRRAPTLSALSVRRRAGKVLLGFRVSERATILIETRRLTPRPQRSFGSFSRSIAAGRLQVTLPLALVRRLRAAGLYRFALVARDAAGNRAAVRFVRLRVR